MARPASSQPAAPGPDLSRQRYGRSTGRQPAVIVVAGVAAALGVAWVVWAAQHWATPQAASRLISYSDITERSVTVQLQVDREAGLPVTCEVQARGAGQVVVGRATIEIPAGEDTRVFLSEVIPTSERPENAELLGCRGPDQTGLR